MGRSFSAAAGEGVRPGKPSWSTPEQESFQQNFASYLYKGNVGKVDQQTFSAVEKTITWCKADRQVGKCAAGCKISLNGVENQSVLAGFNVNQVVERQPVFLGNTL